MLKSRDVLKLGAAATLVICLSLDGGREARALYDVKPDEIPGRPGTIIRIWPLEGGGPSGARADAFRVLYRSTGLNGEPIAVSGAIFVPHGAAPAGGRNVIAWAHPTSGVMPPCAPSLMPDTAGLIWGLDAMLAKGYVVTATDYPGLGTDGIHPYLIGESEGRAVLDSVRAARDLPSSGATDRFAVWGHSQGGHAALYAGELAARYAPELKLVGVAAAAPATYLVELLDSDKGTPSGIDFTAWALLSWARLQNVPVTSLVEPNAMPAFEQVAKDCIQSVPQFEKIEKKVEPWRSMMLHNSPGQAPAGAPVFIAQGTADTTVNPEITTRFGEALCAQGVRVSFIKLEGVSHVFAAKDSAPAALAWMTDRFQGAPAPSDCER